MPVHAASGLGHGGTVRRLLMDLVAAKGLSSFWLLGMLPGLSSIIVDKEIDAAWVMAGSMAFASGASLGGERLFSREYRVLPLTDRDLWVTRCLRAMFVVPAALLLFKAVLMAVTAYKGRTLFSPDTMLISTLFDMVYAGAFLPVPTWLETEGKAIGERSGTSPFMVTLAMLLFSMPVAFALPFVAATSLPKHLHEFSVSGGVTLAIGVTVALAALLWTPRGGGATSQYWERATPAATTIPVAPSRPDNGKGLRGIPVVLWSHAKTTFAIALLHMLLGAAITPWLPSRPEPSRMITAIFLTMGVVAVGMAGVWTSWLRQLKVLPLRLSHINALFVLTPLLTWTAIYSAVLLVHFVLEWPLTIEVDPTVLLACAGATALTHAATLPVRGNRAWQTPASMVGVLVAAGTAIFLADNRNIPVRPTFLFAAVLSFVLAAVINHFTLSRSTSSAHAYRGVGAPGRP